MTENLNPDQFKGYTKHYNAGWTHSSKAASPDMDKGIAYGKKNGDVDDRRGFATNAWEDGYLDAATGRDKYALRGHRFGTGERIEGY